MDATECGMIRKQLETLGLCDANTVIAVDGSNYCVTTSGRYSREYAKLGKPVRASNDDMAMMFGHRIPCVDADALKARKSDGNCIIKDHGFMVTARFPGELIAACILMEKMCKAELLAHRIGRIRHLNPLLCRIEHGVYLNKYSKTSQKASKEGPTPAEVVGMAATGVKISDLALRKEIIRYGKLLVENRLIQATWGNISARIDEDRFLITPSGVDYDKIRPEEIVEIRVDDGSYAEGLRPSSEKKLHQLIYAERADIKAIIHTHSSNCQVFAACRRGLAAMGIAGISGAVDYPCAKYGVSGSEKLAENVAKVMADHDGCIMANHGFVTGADTLEEALAKAVAAERIAGDRLGI